MSGGGEKKSHLQGRKTSAQFIDTAWGKAAGTRALQIMVFPGKLFLHTLLRYEFIFGVIKTDLHLLLSLPKINMVSDNFATPG